MRTWISGLVIAIMVAGCAQQGPHGHRSGGVNKQDVGTLLGAIGGAAVGSNVGKGKGRIVGIAAGTLLGAALGNSIGSSLDQADLMYHHNTAQNALETGRSGSAMTWRNPDSGHYGTVTPVNVVQNDSGQYCREYTQTITVGGKQEEGYGMACRQPDGSWKIQD